MSTRKICKNCKKNFGKSAYYLHLPCPSDNLPTPEVENLSTYIFCDHCNKRVAKKTYYEHQRNINLLNVSSTFRRVQPGNGDECESSQNSSDPNSEIHFDSNDNSYSDAREDLSGDDQDEEDQAFYSDLEQDDDRNNPGNDV
ncbi:hypothetical protein QZH41_009471 [Actinostola sp. cb2023]|nr:hypothetical protein QZH41_009471 [Actinostola sp. cb2023]